MKTRFEYVLSLMNPLFWILNDAQNTRLRYEKYSLKGLCHGSVVYFILVLLITRSYTRYET